MFRAETLWITAFLAIGLIGGVIYNWPDDMEGETETELTDSAKQSDSESDSSDQQGDLRENPQSPLKLDEEGSPTTSPGGESMEGTANQSGLWSQIAGNEVRSQPIDFSVIELGDRLLLGGNATGAYKHFSKLWQQADLPMDPSVLLRLGLASEVAGLAKQAEDHYRSVIRVTPQGSLPQILGLLGTARLWEQRGQLDDAISLLSEMRLLFGDETYPTIVRQSISRQLGDTLQKRLLRNSVVSEALQQEPLQYHYAPLQLDPVLKAADLDAIARPDNSAPTELRLLQNPRGDAASVLLEIRRKGYAFVKLIASLEQLTGLGFQMTERAKTNLVGRLTNIDAQAIPLSLLLDHALEPIGLTWSQSEDMIMLMHRDDLTVEDAASFDLAKTQRTLQQVQLNFTNGPVRTSAIMNDANNCRLSGQWELAEDKYRAAREGQPSHELSAKLYFNEAALSLSSGDKLSALHAAYMTLDQTLTASLQARVYSMIASLELELGQPTKAVVAASRGIRRADDDAVASDLLLTLVRSYLLIDDPDSANSALFDYGSAVQDPARQRIAGVFSSYSRFQRLKPKVGLQDEGQRLVMSLASLREGDMETFADGLILSQAYSAIGLSAKAVDNLREALQRAPSGFWQERIQFSLASLLFENAQVEKAKEVVESFGSVSAEILPSVLLLQARIQLKLGELESCEATCRRLLEQQLDEETKSSSLNLMGQSLERRGDHYAAALCFAGLLPDASAPSVGGVSQ
ncbi:MAG: hypothetical protein AAF802_12475 [Planctomycetota bacterium]